MTWTLCAPTVRHRLPQLHKARSWQRLARHASPVTAAAWRNIWRKENGRVRGAGRRWPAMCPPAWESRKRRINKLKKATRKLIRGGTQPRVHRPRVADPHVCGMVPEASCMGSDRNTEEARDMRMSMAEGTALALLSREGVVLRGNESCSFVAGSRCRVLRVGVESHFIQRADLTLSGRTARPFPLPFATFLALLSL